MHLWKTACNQVCLVLKEYEVWNMLSFGLKSKNFQINWMDIFQITLRNNIPGV